MSRTEVAPKGGSISDVSAYDAEGDDGLLSLPPALIQLWQALLRRWLLIAAIVAATVAAGVIYTMLQPRIYTARSQVEISRDMKNFTNVQGVEQDAQVYDNEFYDTQYALLKAESLAERVAKKLDLASNAAFFKEAHGIEQAVTDKSPAAVKTRERLAAGLLSSAITITPVRNSSLVDISYSSRSPQWSARIASAWPREFIAASMDRRLGSTIDARRLLEERLEGLRLRLEESEQRLIAFGNAHNIITLSSSRDASGKTTETRTLVANNLEALNTALMQARSERIAAESRAKTSAGDASAEVLQNSTVSALRAQREAANAELSRLLVQYQPGYPAARALREQIKNLDAAIARETARVNRGRGASYAEALRREQELLAQVNAAKAEYLRQQQDTIQLGIYQREVDTNRQLYDALLQRYKEIGVAGTVGISNVAIVDDAKVPGGPSAPSLPRNLILSVLLGLGIAAGVVLLLEQVDEAIRNPADVERRLGLPLLGQVPKVDEEPIAHLADSKSPLSEAYFSIRAALELATPRGFPKIIAVTSSKPEEGKSITAVALAATLGRSGRSVLLIDGDMRSPSIHSLIGCEKAPGFSNLLAGDAQASGFIVPTAFKNVSALPSGPMPPSAAELLSSDRLAEVLARLAQGFDHVVVDAPPVIGLADAPLLGRAVEGLVFVLEAEQTSTRGAQGALHRLEGSDIQVFGAVVTKVDDTRYGYGYGYSYAYRYGGGKAAAA